VSNALQRVLRDEDAQDVVEYGLLIATVAIVVLLATVAFGTQIQAWFLALSGRITTT
jgi:Flp pilus assembly pilin Flp